MSELRHMIIENGPYVDGRVDGEPFHGRVLTAGELNGLRDELLELVVLRAVVVEAADGQCGCLGGILNRWDGL